MKSRISALLILCSLSVFSQNSEVSDYEQITMDGKPAFINVKTGEIVSEKPSFSANASVNAKNTVAQLTNQASTATTSVATSVNSSSNTHAVAKGETLYSISKKYNTSISQLKALNPNIDVNALSVNQQINVSKNSLANPAASISNDVTSTNSYVVKKGDTLYSISRMFNVSVADLVAMNSLSSNVISIGQNLKIK